MLALRLHRSLRNVVLQLSGRARLEKDKNRVEGHIARATCLDLVVCRRSSAQSPLQ